MSIKFSREPYINKKLLVFSPDENNNFNIFDGVIIYDSEGKVKEFINPENCDLDVSGILQSHRNSIRETENEI